MKKLIVVLSLVIAGGCGSGDSPIPVAPEVKKASLVVDVRGLPAGLSGAAMLQNGTTSVNVAASTTLTGLTPGTYTFVVQPVEDANARFAPSVASRQVTLVAGATHSIVIDYAEITGRMVVAIDGITPGAATMVDVAGPAGFAARVSQTDTLRKLTPGTYTVTAAPTSGTSRFIPDTALRSVRVDSARIVSVVVRFHAVAQLTILIEGLPAGVAAAVDVAGPAFNRHLTTGATLSDLPLAAYVATPASVRVGSVVYQAIVQGIVLSVGGSNIISIRYAPQAGSISVRIVGGPVSMTGPMSPIVTLTGPTGIVQVSENTVLEDLPFGSYHYTVTAPRYQIHGTGRYSNRPAFAVYSSALQGRNDLTVTLDLQHRAQTIDVPVTLVSGAVVFSAPGSVPTLSSVAHVTVYNATGARMEGLQDGEPTSVDIPAGAYRVVPGYNGEYDTWYVPDVVTATAIVSAAFPIATVVIPYHHLSWPSVSFTYSGMPAGMHFIIDVFDRGPFPGYAGQFVVPFARALGVGSFPGPKRIDFPMPALSADSNKAWVGPTGGMDFVSTEGVTSTVTIPMREANILQIIPTGVPSFPGFAPGSVTVTRPDGTVWDLSASSGELFITDWPTGTYVIKANPIQRGATYVASLSTQTVVLPATGRTIVRITYSPQ